MNDPLGPFHFPNHEPEEGMKEKRQGYVYVLHFDKPLCHAQHYIGCTCDVRQRLITHAQGRGARIVAAAMEQGITWRLAALGVTHVAGMRRIERQLKEWHGCKEQCSLCTAEPRAIPGTKGYPIEEIPWPVDSERLKLLGTKEPLVTFRLTNADDSLRVVNDITRLMKTEKDALGFIPSGGDQGLTLSVTAGRVAVCYVDGVLAGYAAFTENDEYVTIHQCVVSDSQRRCGIGKRMVELSRETRPAKSVRCKVRDDLAANEFWKGIGFASLWQDGSSFETHPTSGQRLNRYECVSRNGTFTDHN